MNPQATRRLSIQQRAGQGMTEYLIIVALIAITSIGVLTIFGDTIKYQMAKSISFLLGDNDIPVKRPKATKKAASRRTLRDFEKSADRR